MTDDNREASGKIKPEVESWLSEIEQAENDMDVYTKRCRGIRDRYRYEDAKKTNKRQFQILWANIEILKPSVYARRPNPEVNSRFKTSDPVVRVTSEILERNLDFQFDLGDFDHSFRLVRDSNLLYARGVARLVYDAEIENRDNGDPGPLSLDKDDPESAGLEDAAKSPLGVEPGGNKRGTDEVLRAENIRLEYVNREDLIHPKARRWKEVPWLAFRSYLDRAALIKRFGKEIGKEIPLTTSGSDDKGMKGDTSMGPSKDKAEVFEIWDKTANEVLWIAKAYPDILDVDEPYIKVQGFYPCPRPVYGTLTDDSLIPVPDFILYQDQAAEINQLTARIGALTDALKLVGFYPAGPSGEGTPEIELAMRPGFENKMIAVKSWAAFGEGKNGAQAPIAWLPIETVGEIIKACIELRKQVIDDVYQITGISDILRGDTEAEETAAAQGIKAQWGSVRLRDRQQEMARFARDVTRMAGEIISQQFSIDTLMRVASMPLPTKADVDKANLQYQQEMAKYQELQKLQAVRGQGTTPPAPVAGASGPPAPPPGGPPQQPLPPPPKQPDLGPTQEDVLGVLRDRVTEILAIEIEVDSTIAADEEKEKKGRVELLEVLNKTMVAAGPIIMQEPAAAPMLAQVLPWVMRAFRPGREVEDIIEKTFQQIASNGQGAKPPSPEMIKAQADQQRSQAEIAKAKIDQQTAAQKAQSDMQATRLKTQASVEEHRMKMEQLQIQAQIDAAKMQAEVAIEGHKANLQAQQVKAQGEMQAAQHQASMQAMQGKAQLDASQMGAQHEINQQKSQGDQKTLQQQMAIQEQKAIAGESLQALGLRGGLMQEKEKQKTAQMKADAAVPPPEAPNPKRKFKIDRGADNRISGISEL